MYQTLVISFLFLTVGVFASETDSLVTKQPADGIHNVQEEVNLFLLDFLETKVVNDSTSFYYVNSHQLYQESWNQLSHTNFWKIIMKLPEDSCVMNVGASRQIIEFKSISEWDKKTEFQKSSYRDSVRSSLNLDKDAKIFMTTGKKYFYDFKNILVDISRGVQVFANESVDPWYAQAILMIESPGKIGLSNAGALGSFQLMPSVARKFGLKVNKSEDERLDFDKSATAASQLIKTVCIPEAKKILDKQSMEYNEQDLWFRLFVMHIYHAGAYNVAGVVNKIAPEEGGMSLIQKMWVTENGSFRNASQNYSQLALAVMMVLDDIVWDCYDTTEDGI